jgi:type IV conjugative transfer system coupling protein TraD
MLFATGPNNMSIFKNITRGGQLQIHQLRMFHQIFKFALWISVIVAGIFFLYQVDRNIPDKQKQYAISYFKAQCLVKVTSIIPKLKVSQKVTIDNKVEKVLSIDILRSRVYFRAYNHALDILIAEFKHSLLIIIFAFISVFGLWFYYGVSQKKTDVTKGIKLVKPEALAKQIKKEKVASDIMIGDLPLIKDAETRHILVTGTTGCGKTNLFDIILPQIRRRKNKAIIIDIKGKYVAKYYNPETDFIFNPLDERSVDWDIWSDLQMESHYDSFAHSIIPEKKNSHDDVWDKSSRIVLVEALKKLAAEGKANIAELFYIIDDMDLNSLERYFYKTNASKLISKDSDKTTFSILMNLVANITPLRYLNSPQFSSKEKFSFRNWITNDKNNDSCIFITARSDQIDSIRALMSAALDTSLNAALSLEEDKARRIWFIADEIPVLHKLSALKKGLTLGRENGCSIILGIQDIPQLRSIYGYDDSKTILNNINTHFIFRYQDSTTAREISEMLGVVEQEQHNETQSYGSSNIKDGVSFSKQLQSKSLVLPIEIANLKVGEAYVKYGGYDITNIKMSLQNIKETNPCFILKDTTKPLKKTENPTIEAKEDIVVAQQECNDTILNKDQEEIDGK